MSEDIFCNDINYLKSAQFKLILEREERTVEFFLQDCILPGYQIGEMQMAWMAQNHERPGDHIQWNILSATVLCDEELKAIKECHNYCMRLKDPETGELGNQHEETFDAKLLIYTNKNNMQHVVTFYNAWIQTVGDLQFSHVTTEDDPITFNVDIQYDYYKFE